MLKMKNKHIFIGILLFIVLIIFILMIINILLSKNARKDFVRAPKVNNNMTNGPIDVVFTWVDSEDSGWKAKKNYYLNNKEGLSSEYELKRYGSAGISQIEIEVSVKLVLKNAPWVRNIYIVTANQTPNFMNTSFVGKHKIKMCSHDEIMKDTLTPTYNSHAIESNLNNIPGLAENFIYLNDDFYIIGPVEPYHFFIDDVPVYRGHNCINTKCTFLGPLMINIVKLINSDSEIYVRASGNVAEILNYKLVCFQQNHHATSMTKSMLTNSNNYLKRLNRANYYRVRRETDVPPIHFSIVYALISNNAYYQENDDYRVAFIDKYNGTIKNNLHEICINYIKTIEDAMDFKNKIFNLNNK